MDKSADDVESSPNSTSEYIELFQAAFTGELDRFQRLALNHAENEGIGVTEAIPKLILEDGRGSLHFAAAGGSLNVCKYLLETLKLDVDPKDRYGWTPLHYAITKGHLDTVAYLFEKGADADASNEENYTPFPLHYAARTDSTSEYIELFKAAFTGKLDRFQRLALNHAENEGIGVGKAIEKLVDEVGKGYGYLHIAAAGGSLEVCRYLLETLKLDVDSKDKIGRTSLYYAIEKGHLDTVTYLLEKGANADATTDENYTPLHYAARTGHTKIITLLLSRGVHLDFANRAGTALLLAAGQGHRDAVEVLLDHGANPNAANSHGILRPLMAAILVKSWECMELLLQGGADPNAESHGNTPLVLAAMNQHVHVVTRLLEAGADPNYKINAGLTALEMAALDRNHQLVGVLFPVTSRIPTYPDWSIAGLMRHVNSYPNKMQMEVHMKEKFHQAKSKGRDAFREGQYHMAVNWFKEALVIFSKDPAVLSNVSACYARLGDGINALDYATKCMNEKPEWPKACYRLGVALNMQKRYADAADAFNKGWTLDPRNQELKDAYMNAVEARLNCVKVNEDNAE